MNSETAYNAKAYEDYDFRFMNFSCTCLIIKRKRSAHTEQSQIDSHAHTEH